MSVRHLLYLEAHRLTAYQWQAGGLKAAGSFTTAPDSLGRFAEYLAAHRRQHFRLLANLADENYAVETIPFLRGGDRRLLIARKISQLFPGTTLSMSISLGYENTRRRNEKLLLAAFARAEQFKPWLDCINSAEAALSGIYSTTQLSGRLLKKLGYSAPRHLLLNALHGSIRESYINDSQPLFSRLATLSDPAVEHVASRFSDEAGKLQQYLIAQHQIDRNETLPVVVIAPPTAIPAIEQTCRNMPGLDFDFIDSESAARRLHLKTPPDDSAGDHLLLHLLACAAPARQFAGEDLRHTFRLTRIGRFLSGLSLAMVFGSSLLAANNGYQAQLLDSETQLLSGAAAAMDERYREIAASFPQIDIDHRTLREVTEGYAGLQRQQYRLDPAFRMLGQALDQSPLIELDSLDWKSGPAADEEAGTLVGSVQSGKQATPRQMLAALERFVALLRANPGITVNVLEQPFAVDPEHPLRGGDREIHGEPARHFSLHVTRRLVP